MANQLDDDDPFGDAPPLTGRGAESQPQPQQQHQPQQSQPVRQSQPVQRAAPDDDDPFGDAPPLTGRGAESQPVQHQQPATHAELPAHVTPNSSWSETWEAAKQNAPVEWSNFKVAAKEAAQHPWDTANKAVEGVGNLVDAAPYTAGEFARRHGWTGTADFLESKINAPGSGKPTIEPPTDTPEQRAAKADVVPGMVRDVGEFVAHPATAFGNAPLSTTANVASVVVPELRAGRLGQLADVVRGVKPAEAAAGAGAAGAAGASAAERETGRGMMQTPDFTTHLSTHGLTPGDLTGASRDAMMDVLGRKGMSPETIKEGIAAGATGEKAIPRHVTTSEPIPEPAQSMVSDSVATGHDAIRNRMGKIVGAEEGDIVAPNHAALARGVENAYVADSNKVRAAYDTAYSTPGTFGPDLGAHIGTGVDTAMRGVQDFPSRVFETEGGAKVSHPDWAAARRSPSLQQTSAAYGHVLDTLSRTAPENYDIGTLSRLRKDLGTFQQAARGDDYHAVGKLIQGFDDGMARAARSPDASFADPHAASRNLAAARDAYRQHMSDFGGKNAVGRASKSMKAELGRDDAGLLSGESSHATAHGAGYDIGKDLFSPKIGLQTYEHLTKIGAKDAADQYIREHVLQHTDRGGGPAFKHSPDQVANLLKQPHISGAFSPEQLSQVKLANAARRLYDTKPSFTRKLSQGWKDNLLHMAAQYGVPTVLGIHGGLGEAAFGALFGPKFESFFAERAKKRAMSGAPKAAKGAKGATGIGKRASDLAWNAGHYAVGVPTQFVANQAARFAPTVGRIHMLDSAGQQQQQQQQRADGGRTSLPPGISDAHAKGWYWDGGWQHRRHGGRISDEAMARALSIADAAARASGGAAYQQDQAQLGQAQIQQILKATLQQPLGTPPKTPRLLQTSLPDYLPASTSPLMGFPQRTAANSYRRGGRVGHQHLVDRLFRHVEIAKKTEGRRTSVLLNHPDEHIAKALSVAQEAI